MSNDRFSKTVRIDLTPDLPPAADTAAGRNDLLAKANWSTRRQQAAVAAATTHSLYEELLESVYDAAVISAPSGRIIEVNGRAEEFLGLPREQLCNMNIIEIIDGGDDSLMRRISETLLDERFALLQAFCRRSDGSLFPAEIAVNRLSMDNVRLCFFIRDVTVRYRTEEMLRMEHAAIQNCASGIAICNSGGLLSYANPALETMLGAESETLVGEDIRTVLGGDSEAIEDLMAQTLDSEQTWMVELEIGDADNPVYAQVSATGCWGPDGNLQGFVFSVADITLHKKAEEESLRFHTEMEARGDARNMDLIEMTDRLQARVTELEQAAATSKRITPENP